MAMMKSGKKKWEAETVTDNDIIAYSRRVRIRPMSPEEEAKCVEAIRELEQITGLPAEEILDGLTKMAATHRN